MKLLKTLFGGSAQLCPADLEKEGSAFLFAGESLEAGFRLASSKSLLITSHRLLVLERSGLTGANLECTTIPHRQVMLVEMSSKQGMAYSGMLGLRLVGLDAPLTLEFRDKDSLLQVYSGLSALICS